MPPCIAIQIIAYWSPEGEVDLGKCLASLAAQTYPREQLTIVIVDNPSPQGSASAYLKEQWLPKSGKEMSKIVLIESKSNTGFAGGHELGLVASKEAGADFIYLLNQDAFLAPDALEKVVAVAVADPTLAVVQSRVMLAQEPQKLNSRGNALQLFGFGYALGEGQMVAEAANSKTPVFYASGAAVLVRVAALDVIGGLFDARYFMYHEDTDLSWRARLAGLGVGYAESSVAYHRYEFSRSLKKFYWIERNRWMVFLSDFKLATICLLLLPMLAVDIVLFLYALKSGWWTEKIKSWGFFFQPSTWSWLAQRRALAKRIRRVSDHEIITHMAATVESHQVVSRWKQMFVDPLLRLFRQVVLWVVRW